MANTKEIAEVFEAVLGNPKPLATLLRSDKRLEDRTRLAIAMFLEGRPVPLEKGRGRPQKFRSWEDYVQSPFARVAMYREFTGEKPEDKIKIAEAIEMALSAKYQAGAVKATKDELEANFRRPKGQRPGPPELQEFRNVEDWIQYQFEEHQRKMRAD